MMTIAGITRPMISKTSNAIELINETFILLITYHLYLFTDFYTDAEIRKSIGISLIVTTLFNVAISIGVVVVDTAFLMARKLKISYLRYK